MVNYFICYYMLIRRLNRNSIEVIFFFNIIDTKEVLNKSNYSKRFFENKDFLNMQFKEY